MHGITLAIVLVAVLATAYGGGKKEEWEKFQKCRDEAELSQGLYITMKYRNF